MIDKKRNYNVSFAIIVITVVLHLIYTFIIINLDSLFALSPAALIIYKRLWTPITYIFTHSGFDHIFFNMFALFIFGHSIEERMGSVGFTLYYIITGMLAGIFSIIVYLLLGTNVNLVGASASIYAVLFAYAVIYPNRKLYFFGIIPINPPTVIILYTAYDLYSQLFRSTNVAHLTHLSGFLFAFLYFKFIFKVNPIFIFKNYKRFSE